MNRKFTILISSLILLTCLGMAVFAQSDDGPRGKLQPLLVDVEQLVPIEAVIEHSDGLTLTVPVTLTVDLRIRLDGLQVTGSDTLVADDPVILVQEVADEGDVAGGTAVNDVAWSVENVERLGEHMKLRDLEHLQFETRGEFLILNIVLENLKNEPTTVGEYGDYSDLEIELIDDRGRSFAPFEVGYLLEELCSSVELNPGIPTPCIIPFEVASNVGDLYLRLSDTDSDDVVQIPVLE